MYVFSEYLSEQPEMLRPQSPILIWNRHFSLTVLEIVCQTFALKVHTMNHETLKNALKVFEISEPLPIDSLTEQYRKLLWMWHPQRYANLTNNPQKYMEMYKKGEVKTKEVHAAFEILKAWLEKSKDHPPPTEKGS